MKHADRQISVTLTKGWRHKDSSGELKVKNRTKKQKQKHDYYHISFSADEKRYKDELKSVSLPNFKALR